MVSDSIGHDFTDDWALHVRSAAAQTADSSSPATDRAPHPLDGVLLGEFVVLTLLAVGQNFCLNKSSYWCSVKWLMLALLLIDVLLLGAVIFIACVPPYDGMTEVIATIAFLVVSIVVGFVGACKKSPSILLAHQFFLMARIVYIVVQVPLMFWLNTPTKEHAKLSKFVIEVVIMPYMFLVLFFNTITNELRKEILDERRLRETITESVSRGRLLSGHTDQATMTAARHQRANKVNCSRLYLPMLPMYFSWLFAVVVWFTACHLAAAAGFFCSGDQYYQCAGTARCVWKWQLCDGQDNCGDGEDESRIVCDRACNDSQFTQCPSTGRCIERAWLCDGQQQCADGADERPHMCTNECSSAAHYHCDSAAGNGTGRCIPQYMLCDDRRLGDGCGVSWQDESAAVCRAACAGDDYFLCPSSGRCIQKDWLCDGQPNCGPQAEDEQPHNCARACNSTAAYYQCSESGRCVHKHRLCDGFDDCDDGQDEARPVCDAACTGEAFAQCESSGRCVSRAWLCVGGDICGDNTNQTYCSDADQSQHSNGAALKTVMTTSTSTAPSVATATDTDNVVTTLEPLRCGMTTTAATAKILGGQRAAEHAWPWQASLLLLPFRTFAGCSAVLIAPRVAITAAHCFADLNTTDPAALMLALGSNKATPTRFEGATFMAVQSIRLHEHYGHPGPHSYDLALLWLEEPVNRTRWVSPVCLTRHQLPHDHQCTLAGWGYRGPGRGRHSQQLWETQLRLVNDSQCNAQHLYDGRVDAITQLCANANDTDACEGDSGGPLMCQLDNGAWLLQGLVSWGDSCQDERRRPGVYTRMSALVDWIEGQLAVAVVNNRSIRANDVRLCSWCTDATAATTSLSSESQEY